MATTNEFINELYETKISTTSSEILLNDTITVTIQLVDFNGNNVNRNNITITCSRGKFTANNQQSYTGNTSNGTLNVTYQGTENGIVNFYCKNAIYSILVFGKKNYRISTTHGGIRNLIVDEFNRTVFFSYLYNGSLSLSTAYSSALKIESNVIPSEYRPSTLVRTPVYNANVIGAVSSDGSVYIRSVQNSGTISNANITFQWTY